MIMQNKESASRREFLKKSSLGLGAGITGVSLAGGKNAAEADSNKLPREITVVGVDLVGLWPDSTTESRIKRMLARMEDIAGLQPDVVCLPELFDTMWVREQKNIGDVAEDEKNPGPVTSVVAEFAKKHSCYVVCPILTKNDGH